MKNFKTYELRDERNIKEKSNLFVEKMVDGIYYVTKNRGGENNVFVSQNKLVEALNNVRTVAIKDKDEIVVYSTKLEELNELIISSRPTPCNTFI